MNDHICPACGGDGNLLGTLGPLTWFRCRSCGAEFTSNVTTAPVDLETGSDEMPAWA